MLSKCNSILNIPPLPCPPHPETELWLSLSPFLNIVIIYEAYCKTTYIVFWSNGLHSWVGAAWRGMEFQVEQGSVP